MCVFCNIAERTSTEAIVFVNDIVAVAITLHQKERNLGAVMIIPRSHFRDIYEVPDEILVEVARVSKLCANAMKKSLRCDGITILQNNEPAGGQDVFHYHVHVIPRFKNDKFFEMPSRVSGLEERKRFGAIIANELSLEI